MCLIPLDLRKTSKSWLRKIVPLSLTISSGRPNVLNSQCKQRAMWSGVGLTNLEGERISAVVVNNGEKYRSIQVKTWSSNIDANLACGNQTLQVYHPE